MPASAATDAALKGVWLALEGVTDPEIPVLNIVEMGLVREVTLQPPREPDADPRSGGVHVVITPTFSGCPALKVIEENAAEAVRGAGYPRVEVTSRLSPPWSTDHMTDEARRKLEEFGIAPPGAEHEVLCPRCRADRPHLVARFGSTACKALMVCSSCGEPFDWFKEL